MLLFLRKAFFYLFAAAYLVFCPILLFHAVGYSYFPGPGAGIAKTGLISVSTDPPGAEIRIGQGRFDRTTPTEIRGLPPGEYPVRLERSGYRPWSGRVTVEAEKAVVLERVLLEPELPETRRELVGPFRNLVALPGSPNLLVTGGSSAGEYSLFEPREGKLRPIFEADSSVARFRVEGVSAAPEAKAILVRLRKEKDRRLVRLEISRDSIGETDDKRLFAGEPESYTWSRDGAALGHETDKSGRVLVWEKKRVGVIEPPEEAGSPQALRWIYSGKDVKQAFWVWEASYALIRERDTVLLVDAMDRHAEGRVRALVRVKRGTSVAYSDEEGKMYFLDTASSSLWSLRVRPAARGPIGAFRDKLEGTDGV